MKKYLGDYICLMLLGAGLEHIASGVAHLVKGTSEGPGKNWQGIQLGN